MKLSFLVSSMSFYDLEALCAIRCNFVLFFAVTEEFYYQEESSFGNATRNSISRKDGSQHQSEAGNAILLLLQVYTIFGTSIWFFTTNS